MHVSRTLIGLKTAVIDVPARAVSATVGFAFGKSTTESADGSRKAAPVGFAYVNAAVDLGGVAAVAAAALGTPDTVPLFVVGEIFAAALPGFLGLFDAKDWGLQRSGVRGTITCVAVGAGMALASHFGLPTYLGALAAIPATVADFRDLANAYAPPASAKAQPIAGAEEDLVTPS